jgi:outer membrane protein TolC
MRDCATECAGHIPVAQDTEAFHSQSAAVLKKCVTPLWLGVLLLIGSGRASTPAYAQNIERITFEEAVRRAVTNNPTIAQAAAGILRAEALLQQVRAQSLPRFDANAVTTAIGPVPTFAGRSITPRTQVDAGIGASLPLLAPVSWAQWKQAADQVTVAQRGSDDVRTQVAVAAAQAYLAVITERRVLELNERARDNARAHYEYANQRYVGGLGSRLNALRAEQELSSDDSVVENSRLGVRRAQEALGVLVATDGPVDAAAEPTFEIPSELGTANVSATTSPSDDLIASRPDLRLAQSRIFAAERVVRDSWRDYLPSVTALFNPQLLTPAGLFAPSRSWRASFVFALPIFEGGERRGLARERQAQLNVTRADRANTERRARSEVRTALEAVRSTERALASARVAAEQSEEVVRITDVAFRAGATTNIEVIDAQRRARDAETQAAIAEDAVRRARLDLLVAMGRFPQ